MAVFTTKSLLWLAYHWRKFACIGTKPNIRKINWTVSTLFVAVVKCRTWWNVWLFASSLLQTMVVNFISLCLSSPVILTLSMYWCTGNFVLLHHPEQFQLIRVLSQPIFFTHTLQISRAISLWSNCRALLSDFSPDSLKISASWTSSIFWMLMSGHGPNRAHLSAQPGH